MASGNPYTAFFVTALTSNPNVFYQSSVDSGYSVDNIPTRPAEWPSAPRRTRKASRVHWFSNHETDLDVYRVYRGSTPGFIAGPATLIAVIPDNQMMDAGGGGSTYYKVAALDRHGNEGPATSAAAASGAVGVPNGVSPALALHGANAQPVARRRAQRVVHATGRIGGEDRRRRPRRTPRRHRASVGSPAPVRTRSRSRAVGRWPTACT